MSAWLVQSSARLAGARSNLVEVLRAHALEQPGRRAYTFLADGIAERGEAESWTWAELDARARMIGAALAADRVSGSGSGERALLLFPPGLDFIAAFFGCLYAGVVAVPCYPPRPRRDHPRLRAIARDARPRFVLTTPELAERREGIAERIPELAAASWLVPAALEPGLGADWDEQLMEETKPETPAFLQYTSGSTALPKGVIVTHGNILHNEEMIRAAFGQSKESVVVGWLPLYHDMGLIGNVLQPLCTGSTAILMPPVAFLQRPARWLEAISRYGATTSGGPNFAYDLCVRKVTPEDKAALDLSSWSVAFNGAEPVRAATLERFAEAFAPCGFRREAFYPCYGLAEATLFVSGGQRGVPPTREYFDPAALEQGRAVPSLPEESGEARILVGCGRAWDGQRIVIADPETGAAVPPGQVGEVWVAGPSVAGGYWDRPEETARTFGVRLAGSGPHAAGSYLRTGDLGFFWESELFVTGRLKDLIILRGRNLYPQDVELAAEASHPGLEPGGGAAFSVEIDGEERLVVVHEVARRFRPKAEDVAEVAAAVRRVVAEELEAQVHEVVLIRTGTLPRTSSGKVQRHACRAGYLSAGLEVVGRDAAGAAGFGDELQFGALPDRETLRRLAPADREAAVVAFLRAELARAAGVAPVAVDPSRPPVESGLDSLVAVELSHRVEAALEISIPLTRWLEAPSLAAVVEGLDPHPPAPSPASPHPLSGRGGDVFPLSHGQRGLWFLERWAPEASAYNIPVPLRLRGDLDEAVLFRAVEELAARHPALRTTFEELGGEPVQRVHGTLAPETFFYKDAARWSEEELGEWLAREAWRPFDLSSGPLLRVALFARGEREHVLLLTVHHLVADFWSLSLLARELEGLYRREAAFEPVARTYADHVARERERLSSGAESLWAYWGERLGGDLPALDLPADRPRPAMPTWRGGSAVLPLGVELSQGLTALARRRGATLFAALLAGFQTLLHRLTGQDDLVVGAPSAGRTSADLAEVVGYFVDTLPLRADLGGDPGFGDLLGRTAGVVSGALAHPVSLALLTERLHPERDPGRSPLFQAMLVLQRAHRPADRDWSAFALGEEGARAGLAGLGVESLRLAERRVPFDLTLMVAEEAGSHGLVASLQYALDLFDPATADRMAAHLRTLLAAAVADPALPLSELPLLSAAESRQVLVEWAEGPTLEAAPDHLLHELFLDQAGRTPQAVALIAGEERWTYEDLAARSAAVADRLRALGVGPEDRVGICAHRSPELVAGLLGILQAGGAYVPLDPAHPRPRLARILADARPAAVLVREGLEEVLPEHGLSVITLAADPFQSPPLPGRSEGRWERGPGGEGLAYLIYTSGSTGEPKGVAIRHASAVALVRWAWKVFPEADLHRVLASTSIGFDLSVFELFVPLSRGGAVVLAENVLALPELPAADEVTLVNTVPSALSTLLRTSGLPASVRTVNLAGEPLTGELAARLHELPQVERVFNLYGPSEDTTYSTFSLVERGETPTIGRPLAGTRARVLDRRLRPVPPGVAGELCLGGAGLARGYLGRPELTAERWVPDAFAGSPGERLYRTGDLARFLPDGRLEFLGRIDHQVKVRGFRVEPGEIEAALVPYPGVAEAVVVARGQGGERRLVAFVIRQDEQVDAPALAAFLQKSLPAHLVPAAFSFVGSFPRTATGKVDRKALAQAALDSTAREETEAPRGPVEEIVAGLWAELLEIAPAGRGDDFFALGGHSLLAARLVARVREAFGVDLPLRAVFARPTVAAFAAEIEAALGAGAPSEPLALLLRDGAPLPASFSQEQLWLFDRLQPGSAAYNMPVAFRIAPDGSELDVTGLAVALTRVAERHEALRTTLDADVQGHTFQRVHAPAAVALPLVDLSGLPWEPGLAEAARLAAAEAGRPFELSVGPLFRTTLLRLPDGEHRLLLTLHHAIADARSLELLFGELVALYEGDSLRPVPAQYADFAAWQRARLSGEALEALLAFWRRSLAGAPPVLDLPVDHPRPAAQSFRGAIRQTALPNVDPERLRALGRAEGVTPFMLHLAVFETLVHRLTGLEDFALGTPVSIRSREELEGVVGFFVNVLVLHAEPKGEASFRELLGRVRTTALAAYAHAELPFETLVADLAPERSASHTPLVQVMFALEEEPGTRTGGGLVWSAEGTDRGAAQFDLSVSVRQRGDGLRITAEYASALFDAPTVDRFLAWMGTLLAGAVADPGQPLGELPLLGEAERAQLLIEWNDTRERIEWEAPVHELFARQAERTPDAMAVVVAGEACLGLTYGELRRRAGRLARRLRALGVEPEVPVAAFVDRSLDMAVGLLGILESGGVFVPLDPAHPADRLALVLEDSGAPLAVTQEGLLSRLPAGEVRPVLIDESADEVDTALPAPPLLPEHPVYMIYTSGSTGRPKGVVITQRSFAHHCRMFPEMIGLDSTDRVLQFASLSFDVAVEEMLPTWLTGGCLVLWPEAAVSGPAELTRLAEREELTRFQLSTQYWQDWTTELARSGRTAPPSLRWMMAGGEAVSAAHLALWQEMVGDAVSWLNGYGPTEATVTSSGYALPSAGVPPRQGSTHSVPIGRPFTNERFYVVDFLGRPVPPGVAGELWLGGPGLARGYACRPDLTATRFVPDPFADTPGERLYRTGDLVRFLATGDVEFLGRLDRQVKLRGFRIELGEVESALAACPLVQAGAVLIEGEGAARRLVAYVAPVVSGVPEVTGRELRAWLRGVLPDPMVPSAFVLLPELPITASGKIDRQALSRLEIEAAETEVDEDAAAPRTPVEEILTGIWAEVLGLPRVGVHGHFFELGGHSLLATQVVSRVREFLGVEVPLARVFELPTPAALASRVEELRRETGELAAPPLVPTPREEEVPLSFAQERLWFLDRLEPGGAAYNVVAGLAIRGDLAPACLEAALGEVVRRHESLRTTFHDSAGGPVQVIAPAVGAPQALPLVDLSGLPPEAARDESEALLIEEARRPFDLEHGPLLRATLLRRGDHDHALLFNMHHIVSDGWSAGVLVREVSAFYAAALAGEPSPLPELAVQYPDFALWQRGWLQREALARQLGYWRERLDGVPALALPADRPRPAVRSFRGDTVRFAVGAEVTAALEGFARRHGATLYMALLAGFTALLRRITGQDDLAVGSPVANRNRAETEPLIGFFVNTLVLRADAGGDPEMPELLARVRGTALDAYAHQDLPFERLVEELRPERHLSHNPLFQVMFALQNAPFGTIALPGLTVAPMAADLPTAKFDLALSFTEEEGGLTAELGYAMDLFDATTVQRLAGHVNNLLAGLAAEPLRRVSGLPLLTEGERHQLTAEWNDTEGGERETGVVPAFAAQAALRPEAIAVEAPGGPLTYGELDRRSDRLARRLRALGVSPGTPVGLCMERTADLAVGLLGIWKAGGAYVPLDPSLPQARLAYMLEDSGVTVLVTLERLDGSLPPHAARQVFADAADEGGEDVAEAGAAPAPGDLAYLLYTSGTTGQPKAVMVEHGQLAASLGAMRRAFGFGPGDRMPCVAPFSFDIFLFELLAPLLAGGTSVLVPLRPVLDVERWVGGGDLAEATALHAVPALMRQVVDAAKAARDRGLGAFPRLRALFVGGDAVSAELLADMRQTFPGARTWVLYGPTEATIVCSAWPVPAEGPVRSLLGRPLDGAVLELRDRDGRLVPLGVAGEIWIGGAGVTRGYWNRGELTAERFVETEGGRRYRSGDLARRLPDGTLEFLGRLDGQVKVRGFRIELGEVEAALARHPGVHAAVAAVRDDPAGRRLVAYVVRRPEAEADPSAFGPELRRFLQGQLPEYMVPGAIVELDALPLTVHGKVDRAALPAPEVQRAEAPVEPRTPLEARLVEACAEVLGLDRAGAGDDFFELGGHSLLATRFVSRLRERWGIDLPVRAVFEAPVLGDLADLLTERELGEAARGLSREERSRLYEERRAGDAGTDGRIPRRPHGTLPPLSFAQERLWFLDRLEAGTAYNMPMALELHGELSVPAFEAAFRELVRRHENLRTTFVERDGAPVQVIDPAADWRLLRVDLGGVFAAAPEEAAAEARFLFEAGAWRRFDLERGPLLRGALLHKGPGEHLLLLDMHHVISDGWSMGVLIREVSALYAAALEGRPSPLPELAIQYADFAVWQRGWLTGEVLESQLAYWRDTLDGAPSLDLPTDRPRPAAQSFRGASVALTLSSGETRGLQELARRHDATLYMVLLAASQLLLGRYAGQDDLVTGGAIANRNRADLEPLIGFFVNSLVLRGDLAGDPPFTGLVERARRVTLGAYSHQDLPFERLVEELRPERRLSHNPLFQVMCVLQNAPAGRIDLPGLWFEPLELDFSATRFDLELMFWHMGDELLFELIYATDLYDEATARRMQLHFANLVTGILEDPSRRLSDLPLLTPGERRQLLHEWNDTASPLPDSTLADLFREQVAQRPDAIALSSPEGDLTYSALHDRATRLALHLASLGAGPEVPVALLADRSPSMIIGLLAILEAGGAYLPLDPSYPPDRLAHMRQAAEADLLLADPALLPDKLRQGILIPLSPNGEGETWESGPGAGDWTRWAGGEASAPEGAEPSPLPQVEGDNLAYVMFTSGSTGRPKATGVTHRNVIRLVRESRFADLGPDQVFLQLAPISFDASTLEIWGALANGGRLVLAPAGRNALEDLADTIETQGVTTLWLTAGLFHQMVDGPIASLRGLRQLLAGGDVLSPDHVRRALAALPGCTVINGYGPTEGTTFTCCHPMTQPDGVGTTVPIGTPIGNTRVLVLGRDLQPVPAGVHGELFAGGGGLSRGYLDRPDLTAERFVPDPFAGVSGGEPGARLYRTGDLVRWRADGRLEFLGRRDGQLKLRGYRIELGEIESALARHPEVREAAVVVRDELDGSGSKRLVACVVPRPAEQVDDGDAAGHVAQWQELYEETYGQGPRSGDATFNIQGWNSSYTGEPIPTGEMREWLNGTVERLLALPHRQVLEIGCGTGLLLFQVAPHAERYRGTDFSAAALAYVRRQLHGLPQVELAQGLADDWSGVAPGEADLVILNSVVQYFPGIDYLVRVLEGAVRAVAPGGAVFVGDVRSLPLLEAIHTSVELYQQDGSLGLPDLRQRIGRRVADEEELVIHPAFFHALARRLPGISGVEVLAKRGRAHNELTRFRYDVVLYVGRSDEDGAGAPAGPVHEAGSLAEIESLVAPGPETLVLAGIPNARLAEEEAALELLGTRGLQTVERLRRAVHQRLDPQGRGVDPQDLWELGERLGYRVRVLWGLGSPFRFDAVLERRDLPLLPARRTPAVTLEGLDLSLDLPWTAYANDPLRRQLARRLVPELRRHLQDELPEYMVPAAFVLLDALPLTANGKVDRRALASIEPVSAGAPVQGRVAPRTPAEEMVAAVWRDVLGLESFGIHDDFFELGGHSLLATQVISRLRQTARVEIPLRTLFEAPTVAALAAEVETLTHAGSALVAPPIVRLERQGDPPPSFAQEWMWLVDQLDPEGTGVISLIPVRLRGRLDVPALGAALDDLVRRHEVLRTTFPLVDGRPVQRIAPARGLPLPLVDLQALPAAAREAEVDALALAEGSGGMSLERGPLLRARLLRLGPDDHSLLIAPHHILLDGWSIGVLMREMAALYEAFGQGRPSPLPELPVQYADYALWQRQWLQGEPLDELLGYWRRQLAAPLAVLELPGSRPEAAAAMRSARVPVALGPELSAALRALAQSHGVTPFVALLAAFQALLHRYTRQTDVPVGSSVANRNSPEIEGLIGYFVNTLVLRTDLGGDPGFAELLTRVREVALGAYAHQDLPFTRLVEELQPDRAASRTPLFQAFFLLQNMPMPKIELPGLVMTGLDTDAPAATFDLALVLADGDQGLAGSLWYNRDLLEEDTVSLLMERYRTLLAGAVADPACRVSALPLVSDAERRQLLAAPAPLAAVSSSGTGSAGQAGAEAGCLHRRFTDRVQDDPEAVALVFEGDETTYRELEEASNRLAWYLQELGVGPDVLVGICLERSPEMVIALLAVLKAGGAYLPLDPAYPQERLRFLLQDAGARVLVTRGGIAARLADLPADLPAQLAIVDLDVEAQAIARRAVTAPVSGVQPENLAYVIYTSGSTGTPKGVMVTHANVTRLFESTESWFRFDERDVWTLFHSYAFDFSVWEIWGALLHGGKLVIVPFMVSRSPEAFHELLERERVTVLNQTPSAFAQLASQIARAGVDGRRALKSLRWVVFGGEALNPRSLDGWFQSFSDRRPRLVNMYGITETTVHVTHRPLTAADVIGGSGGSMIGEAIPDLTVHLLDAHLQPAVTGLAGEMYVGGAGLSRGYLGRPDLTAERFIPDPFATVPGARLYRSGDLARQAPGQAGDDLEYLGRADDQVKIRGFRIEPGEVEAALASHPAVAEAVVVAREDEAGDKRLVGYVVPTEPGGLPVRRLLRYQREGRLDGRATHELPNGMVVVHQHEGVTASIYKEIFEGQVYRRHGIELPPGACIFDIGANLGLFTLWAGTTVPGARLFSFEPIPATAEVLRLNAELYGLDATVYAAGVADAERTEVFTFYPYFPSTSGRFPDLAKDRADIKAHILNEQRVLGEELGGDGFETWRHEREGMLDSWLDEHMKSERVTCRLTTVSSVIREHGLGQIDLLKIDAERSELDVLAGIAEEDWPKVRQMVLEVHDAAIRDRVLEILEARGFEAVVEQDVFLEGTELFNVYARRRGAPAAGAPVVEAGEAGERVWASPARLADELRHRAVERLPEHMVPSAVVVLEEWPLTAHGKLDRRALPEPAKAERVVARPIVEPRTPVERELVEIWKELLRVDRVSIYDNFFELGGHSLLLTQLASRIRTNFQVEVPLRVLFDVKDVVEMTAAIAERQVAEVSQEDMAEMLDELKGLSPEEIKALLEAES